MPAKPKALSIADLSRFTLDQGRLSTTGSGPPIKKFTNSELHSAVRELKNSVDGHKIMVKKSGNAIADAVNTNTLSTNHAITSIFAAADATAHFQKIDKNAGIEQGFIAPAIQGACVDSKLSDIESITIPNNGATCITETIVEAKSSLEKVHTITYMIAGPSSQAATGSSAAEKVASMYEDTNVSTTKTTIPVHVRDEQFSSPLKRRISEALFGHSDNLDHKRPRQRLSITPIQHEIKTYIHVDPINKTWIKTGRNLSEMQKGISDSIKTMVGNAKFSRWIFWCVFNGEEIITGLKAVVEAIWTFLNCVSRINGEQ